MKKSNKLLLGGFLTLLLAIAAVQITLSARYKSGNYTLYTVDRDPAFEAIEGFSGARTIKVENISSASIAFSDVPLVSKQYKHLLELVRDGETLVIRGKYKFNWDDSSDQVILYLPANLSYTLKNSTIIFRSVKLSQITNVDVNLQNGNAIFSGTRVPMSLDNLKIVALQNSNASLIGNTTIKNMDVQLSNSSVSVNEATPGNISIITDSISRISLPYKLFSTAKITTTTGQ